jgi:hypothetical protein
MAGIATFVTSLLREVLNNEEGLWTGESSLS